MFSLRFLVVTVDRRVNFVSTANFFTILVVQIFESISKFIIVVEIQVNRMITKSLKKAREEFNQLNLHQSIYQRLLHAQKFVSFVCNNGASGSNKDKRSDAKYNQ